MDIIKKELTCSELQKLNEENLFNYIKTYARTRHSEVIETNEMLYVMNNLNGVSMLNNCVYKIGVNKFGLKKTAGDILSKFKARGLPVYWYISPVSGTAALEDHLRAKELIHIEDYYFMHLDMTDSNTTIKNKTLIIKQVSDVTAAEEFFHIYSVCFELSKAVEKELHIYHSKLLLDPLISAYHYIGYMNGKPVGTSTVFYNSGIAGIYNITVLPEARNMFIGHDMTITALSRAKKDSYKYAALQATELGSHVYKKIGFQSYGEAKAYIKLNGISWATLPYTFMMRKTTNLLREKTLTIK